MAAQSSDLLDIYTALQRLLPRERRDEAAWGNLAVYRPLRNLILRLLDDIAGDQGRTPGLPKPLELISQLDALGMDVRKHYLVLLSRQLAAEMPAEEILPVFEAAVKSQVSLKKPEAFKLSDVEQLFGGADGERLYCMYLYLHHLEASSPVLEAIDAHSAPYHQPTRAQVKTALRLIRGLSPRLAQQLSELLITLKLRHMLKEHQARLRPVLDRFKETNDLPGLTSLYRSVRALQPSPMHEGIYAYFINAFLSFWRSQDMALRVWEDMIMGGITPTAKSWNALLRYGHGRDRTALLAIWKRMVLTGVVPDVYCWTTRIHLQMLADEVQDGLESFEQMIEAGVKPTIETINAAMDGLLSFNRFDEIDHVVSMADHLGVPANIITYNTLLRGMLRRRGAATEVIPLLESMHSRGISPDVYTFTIALDGLYKAARVAASASWHHSQNDESLPNPDAPSFSYILELFRYMEGLGIDANVTTYTALVGGLLDTGNLAAVDVVRRVMARKGVVGNADFYTVLIKSAFQRCDIGAADRYADEITHLRVRRDHIFWMELIWGYAQFGETVKMAAAIDAMKREPVRMVITLKGHVTILRALERRGERIVAKGIIEDVVKEWEAPPRLPDAPDAPSKVEMEFWSVVAKIGGTGWMAALREEAGRREARDREEIARDHLARVVDIVGVREERNV